MGKLWENIGKYGKYRKIWENMGNYGKILETMGKYGPNYQFFLSVQWFHVIHAMLRRATHAWFLLPPVQSLVAQMAQIQGCRVSGSGPTIWGMIYTPNYTKGYVLLGLPHDYIDYQYSYWGRISLIWMMFVYGEDKCGRYSLDR